MAKKRIQREELRILLEEKKTPILEIAKMFGVTKTTVYRTIKQYGIHFVPSKGSVPQECTPESVRADRDVGMMTVKEIANKYGITLNVAYRIIRNFGIKLTKIGNAPKPSADGLKTCSRCHLEFPIETFPVAVLKKGGTQRQSWCRECAYAAQKDAKYWVGYRKRIKAAFVIEKGDACSRCGAKELPICCYSFHHRDMKEKELSASYALNSRGKKEIAKELDKCDLVCMNCHHIEHWGTATASEILSTDKPKLEGSNLKHSASRLMTRIPDHKTRNKS